MAPDLDLHCLPMSHIKDVSLAWIKIDIKENLKMSQREIKAHASLRASQNNLLPISAIEIRHALNEQLSYTLPFHEYKYIQQGNLQNTCQMNRLTGLHKC